MRLNVKCRLCGDWPQIFQLVEYREKLSHEAEQIVLYKFPKKVAEFNAFLNGPRFSYDRLPEIMPNLEEMFVLLFVMPICFQMFSLQNWVRTGFYSLAKRRVSVCKLLNNYNFVFDGLEFIWNNIFNTCFSTPLPVDEITKKRESVSSRFVGLLLSSKL